MASTSGGTSMAAAISGELREFHKVALDFRGPPTGEQAPENPFTD